MSLFSDFRKSRGSRSTNDPPERTKIAILGGGVGGMAAAFWLTDPHNQVTEQCDVTVYQMGWRLGGKGASGRNLQLGKRIEEHGLHVWFGFYDNAFYLMRRCYDELVENGLRSDNCPIQSFCQAFHRTPVIGLFELFNNRWTAHRFPVPEKPAPEVGTIGDLPTIWHLLTEAVEQAWLAWDSLCDDRDHCQREQFPHRRLRRFLAWAAKIELAVSDIDLKIKEPLLNSLQRATSELSQLALRPPPSRFLFRLVLRRLLFAPLLNFKRALWRDVVKHHLDDAGLRLFFTTFDTLLSSFIGVVEEDAIVKGFLHLDDQELCEFLRKHGAEEFTLELEHSPLLRGWYDAAFAYKQGDKDKPNLAAGTGVHGLLRLLGTYKESVAFKMQAGMGDTIFGPLYEVLKHRGVAFEFFHRVKKLGLSSDGSRVERINIVRQARLAVPEYDPFVDVLHLPCWPSEPRWEQLLNGDELKADGINFEYGMDEQDAQEFSLKLGQDFDQVVLAIPAPALADICAELTQRNPKFRAMIKNCASTMTQAAQIWTTVPLLDLGEKFDETAIATSFVEPVDTYCDMSQLLAREDWGANPPKGVAYFCGVMPDQSSQEEADAAVRETAGKLIKDHVQELWTDGFTWNALFDQSEASGEGRLEAQYFRANYQPTERYVQSPKGSVRYRLASDALAKDKDPATCCRNLYLAGDWTLNGINGGCVEAAVMSGMLASRAISKHPKYISGENFHWLTHIEQ